MKLRLTIFIALALLLSACNFSLAEDVTPPPDYVSPVPPPTTGPLVPPQPASIERGALVYQSKCLACHGPKGLGDGVQGKQLPVPVAAIGLADVALNASPADWYTVVTQGRIDRFMPPFSSLSEQERWDVVAYAFSLHTTPEQVLKGEAVMKACAECSLDFFRNPAEVSSLSDSEIVDLLKNGNDQVTALKGASNDDLLAAAAYLRTLAYAESSQPAPTAAVAAATPTAQPTELVAAASPAASGTEVTPAGTDVTPVATEGTSQPVTPEAATAAVTPNGSETPAPSKGTVSGIISGGDVGGATVTLHGYDHGADQSAGPQETMTLTGTVNADGSYKFDNVDLPSRRIFVAEINYEGIKYQSGLGIVDGSTSDIKVPEIKVYKTTSDYSKLVFSQVHVFLEVSDQAIQVVSVYTFANSSTDTILVEATTDVPFIKTPENAQNVGFDLAQDSATIMSADKGFALPPSDKPYGIIAFYTLPYNGKLTFQQPYELPVQSLLVLVPDGMTLTSDRLTAGSTQTFQGTTYKEYDGTDIKSKDVVEMTVEGTKKASSNGSAPNTVNSRQSLLIGVGALGLVLVLGGVALYLRERKRSTEEEDLEDEELEGTREFESQDEILDAIIALDDLHRAGKITDEAYQQRRAELKAQLKDLG